MSDDTAHADAIEHIANALGETSDWKSVAVLRQPLDCKHGRLPVELLLDVIVWMANKGFIQAEERDNDALIRWTNDGLNGLRHWLFEQLAKKTE